LIIYSPTLNFMISGQINYKVRVDSELSHSGYSKTTSYVVLD